MAVDVDLLNSNSINNIDSNFERVQAALQDAVSRSGTTPNQMNADLDMNSNDILNVNVMDADSILIHGVPIGQFNGTFRGEWAIDVSYLVNDIVRDTNGNLWIAKRSNIGVPVGENDDWTLFLPGATVADGTITTDKLTDGAVTNDKILDETITETKLTDSLTVRLANMCSDIATLKALDTTRWNVAYLTLARKQGLFVWRTGDYSTQVTADTTGAIYLKADAIATSVGAWVRETGPTVRPEWFGAVGDGATDDTAAIQAAVDFVKTTGGTVEFDPKGRYGISNTVIVASYRPVNLFSRMGEIGNNDNAAPLGGYIFPMNNIAGAMIEYTDPTNIDVGYDQHSGTIDGLTFFDQAGNPASPLIDQRVYSVTAALKLTNFLNANVRNCSFNRIKGSAIWGQFVIKSHFLNIRVHYCGAVGAPALRWESRDVNHYMQGCTLQNFKIEVCTDSYYMYIDPRAVNNTFDDFIWESAPEAATESTQTFVYCAGSRNFFTNQHVSRNDSSQAFYLQGDRNFVQGVFASHSGNSLFINGNYNRADLIIHDCTGSIAVQIAGAFNTATGTIQEAGALYNNSGSYCSFDDWKINTSRITSGPVIQLGTSAASARNNTIVLPSIVAGVHGIQHTATGGVIANNNILNASTAIACGSSTNVAVLGNYIGARTIGVASGTGTVATGNVNP